MFMQLINEVLHEHLYKGTLVYLNSILIYTKTMEEEHHVKLIRTIHEKLCIAQHYAKLFHKTKLYYLGYCIWHEGVKMDPEKV